MASCGITPINKRLFKAKIALLIEPIEYIDQKLNNSLRYSPPFLSDHWVSVQG